MITTPLEAAAYFHRNAFRGAVFVPVFLAVAPFLREAHDLLFLVLWTLLLFAGLVALVTSAHLALDAVLFRLIASTPDERKALEEVDNVISRTGLKALAQDSLPLSERIENARQLVNRQRLLLAICFILFLALAFLPGTILHSGTF